MPSVLFISKSVKVYLPLVCRVAPLPSTTPLAGGLTRLATFMLFAPLLAGCLVVGSGVDVTCVVAAEVACVGAFEVVCEGADDDASAFWDDLY